MFIIVCIVLILYLLSLKNLLSTLTLEIPSYPFQTWWLNGKTVVNGVQNIAQMLCRECMLVLLVCCIL